MVSPHLEQSTVKYHFVRLNLICHDESPLRPQAYLSP
jgi:hypothetical protein